MGQKAGLPEAVGEGTGVVEQQEDGMGGTYRVRVPASAVLFAVSGLVSLFIALGYALRGCWWWAGLGASSR